MSWIISFVTIFLSWVWFFITLIIRLLGILLGAVLGGIWYYQGMLLYLPGGPTGESKSPRDNPIGELCLRLSFPPSNLVLSSLSIFLPRPWGLTKTKINDETQSE